MLKPPCMAITARPFTLLSGAQPGNSTHLTAGKASFEEETSLTEVQYAVLTQPISRRNSRGAELISSGVFLICADTRQW